MMTLEYNGQRIGAMQYNGVTIGEAMMDGQIVYQSAVKLTGTSGMTSRYQLRDAVEALGLDYRTITHLPFKIDTSEATSLLDLFNGWTALVVAPEMTTLQVTDMGGLFRGCTALEYVGDLQTSNVTNAGFMFDACPALTDGNVRLLGRHPNVSTTAIIANSGLTREPWYSADGLRALITPAAPTFHEGEPWVTLPTVEGVTYSVSRAPSYGVSVTVTATAQAGYELMGIASWTHTFGPDPRPVVTITGTSTYESRDQFRAACTAYGINYETVTVLPFQLDTSNATRTDTIFYGCAALTSVPALDTSNVTSMRSMFYGCSSLTTVPEMDTSNVTDMSTMFYRCPSLTSVPNMDTPKNKTTANMFNGCSSLTTAPEMDTSNVTHTTSMFEDCSSLTYVPDLVTSKAFRMTSMFENCSSLTDGNVRLIGKDSNPSTGSMIAGSGLTREPFYDTNGNPI